MEPEEREKEPLSPEFEQDEETKENPYDEENQEYLDEVDGTPSFLVQLAIEPQLAQEHDKAIERYSILSARTGLNALRGGVRKPEATENGGFTAFFVCSLSGHALEEHGVSWEELSERYQQALSPFVDWVGEQLDAEEED